MGYIFLKSKTETDISGNEQKILVPFEGQTIEGVRVDELMVKHPYTTAMANPEGTYFASKDPVLVVDGVNTPHIHLISKPVKVEKGLGITEAGIEFNNFLDFKGAEATTVIDPEQGTVTPQPSETKISRLSAKYPVPKIEDCGFYVDKDAWKILLVNLDLGYNTMLVGESGTGKTELVQLLSERIGSPLTTVDMGSKQDPIASLIGVHRFKEGKSTFDRAQFTYALETEGIVLFDELPRAPMNTSNILFPVLDSRKSLHMDIASSGERAIKVHPKCRFLATANDGYAYTGNNEIDAALKERFQLINIEFPPKGAEVKVVVKRTEIDKKSAEIIVDIAYNIRKLKQDDQLSAAVSLRHTIYAGNLVNAGMTVLDAMETSYLAITTDKDEKKQIRDIIASK